MKYFVDTNIFLRVLVRESQSMFGECSNCLSLIECGKIKATTSDIVLSEVVWTLKRFYKLPKTKIIKSLHGIYEFKFKYDNNFQTKLAVDLFKNKSVKYIDCLIASIPEVQNKKWTVISYDKDFDKLGVKRKEPGEII